MSSNLEPLIPPRPATRTALVILCGFTAALCWWIALAGIVNSAAGIIFLAIPVLATIATLRAARRRPHKAQHVEQLRPYGARGALSVHRKSIVVLCGFTAVLCWWIAIVAVVHIAAGTVVLTVPVLATIGTFLAARYKGQVRKA